MMADNLNERGAGDRTRINVNQAHELAYWSRELGVTEAQLRQAVQQAGPMADDVRRHLGKVA
jgi:hypothetical protein